VSVDARQEAAGKRPISAFATLRLDAKPCDPQHHKHGRIFNMQASVDIYFSPFKFL
jgi:hypothetical protein